VLSRDVAGQENPGLYWMNSKGGELHLISHQNKIQSRFAFISDNSQQVYYFANDIKPDSYALYRFDLKTNSRELVFSEPGLWSLADRREQRLLLSKALGSDQFEIYEYDLGKKSLVPLMGQNEKVRYDVGYAAKPDTLLVLHDKNGDFFRLYEWKNGQEIAITPEMPYEVDGFFINEDRSRISYSINENGYSRLHVLDAKTYKPLELPKLPEADHIGGGGMTRDGRFMSVSINGATQPGVVSFYDWKNKSLTQWRTVSTPEVDVSRFTRAKLDYYPARDGAKIPAFVWRSKACEEKTCPVVVEFHGGPEGQSRPGFAPFAQLYVDAGFVFVQPNVRGSSGYGKSWLDADNGAKRLDVITDIEDAGLYAKKAFAVNGVTPKVGVTGGSYGGYSTLMAMTYFAGTFDAGVSEVGIANLLTFLENTAPYRRALRASEYGDPVKDREALIKLSATSYVDRLKAPLLIIQGVNDPRVPVGEALLMHESLQKRGIASQLILFADEGHGTSKRGNRVLAQGHEIAFFEKHLK
jgi:prolyl oligopeptidase PreP (S9A serine peptidase family)